jgi:hypothetical protein
MKAYGGVDVEIHVLLALVLVDKLSVSSPFRFIPWGWHPLAGRLGEFPKSVWELWRSELL